MAQVPKRLDHWLKERFPSLSNRHIEEAISEGLVVNAQGNKLKKGEKLSALPDCSKLEKQLLELKKGNPGIKEVVVVSSQKDFLVIDKPPGLPSHPIGLFDVENVTAWTFAYSPLVAREWKEEAQPTLCPHRLDTDTSGLLIVCLTQKAYKKWRELFSKKALTKTYFAWCWGKPKKEKFEVVFDLAHHPKDSRKMVAIKSAITKHRPPLLKGKTSFKVIKKLNDRFLVEAQMKTGVTHQVRVHLSALGFPLIGDELYDDAFEKRAAKQKGHLLRAAKIEGEGFLSKVDSDEFKNLFN